MDMTVNDIKFDEIKDDIRFVIRYCDLYIEYCHKENLMIDGDLNSEIYDLIYEIEEIINNKDVNITVKDINELTENLKELNENITSLNDIDLFNHVHIIFTNTIKEIISQLEQSRPSKIE